MSAPTSTHTTNHLFIDAVAELCAEIEVRSQRLFEFCGGQIRSTAPGTQQRWWSRACHQHGAHIDLASDRMPTIPIVDPPRLLHAATEQGVPTASSDSAPLDTWRQLVDELIDVIDVASSKSQRDLDPSTARLAMVITGDLRRLTAEVGGGEPSR